MAEQRNAIEIQGITRNATKIGVQDGQAEDLINLRFQDGSWRASGDGKKVFYMGYHGTGPVPSTPYVGTTYEQLYVHTNVYRHLLGVVNSRLYWFANISADGVFEPLTTPVKLTDVSGQIYICQTGHLITVIDSNSDDESKLFSYFVFKTSKNEYIKANIDTKGKQNDRTLYPWGQVRFNLYSPAIPLTSEGSDYLFSTEGDTPREDSYSGLKHNNGHYQNLVVSTFGKAKEKNKFTGGFIAVAAIELYDGSYLYASQPCYLCPKEQVIPYESDSKTIFTLEESGTIHAKITIPESAEAQGGGTQLTKVGYYYARESGNYAAVTNYTGASQHLGPALPPVLCAGCGNAVYRNFFVDVIGSDLCFHFDNMDILEENKDIFSAVCIFVTPEAHLYDLSTSHSADTGQDRIVNIVAADGPIIFVPYFITKEKYIYELVHSPLYLLKRYDANKISELRSSPIVNLTRPEDEGLLKNLPTETKVLTIEALERTSYKPKVINIYNGRLHIADYTAIESHGYPIDCFQLSNHSVEYASGQYFPTSTHVLSNVKGNYDDNLQYQREKFEFFPKRSDVPSADKTNFTTLKTPLVVIKTTREDGNASSCYIEAYNTSSIRDGVADYIEDLSPFIISASSSAKKIDIYLADYDREYGYLVRHKEFVLNRAYPYAYYFKDDAKPISFYNDFSPITQIIQGIETTRFFSVAELDEYMKGLLDEEGLQEDFPNGLKVSKTDNPLFFPVENTYQVGSGEILAICSNAIAVGTGQTGAAPLYVFCTDGLYALFVDESGEMAYTNARVIARDVLNNADSVTPIDAGVVFTTDRGLMMISGEQVEEIGAPAEGDVEQFANASSPDYNEFIKDRLTKVAELPLTLCDATDFLTYLKDKGTSGKAAIINYNHNQRELIVSNPNYPYSYVMDRDGNWSRRDYSADEYVNNYPTSYRVKTGVFYKVDEEGDANTPLEQRKEADNQIFYLSNEIKLGSIGFKQAYRFVVRGYFETLPGKAVGCYLQGSYDGRKWATIGGNEKKSGKFTNIGCHVSHADMRFYRICLAGQVTGKTRIDYMEMSSSPSVLNTKIR